MRALHRSLLLVLPMVVVASTPHIASATSFGAQGKCVGWIDAARSGPTTVSAMSAVKCTAAVTSLGNTTFCITHKVNGVLTRPSGCWFIMTSGWTYADGRTVTATPGIHEFCTIVGRLGSATAITGGCDYVTV